MGEICFEMTGPDGFSIQITDDQTFNCMVIENPGLEIPVPSIPSINPDTITEDFPTGSILVSNSNKVAAISQPLTIDCNSVAAFPVLNGHVMQRRALASLWASLNPVMLAGELGIEVDTKQMKIGDGVTAWNSLAYSFDPIGAASSVMGLHLLQPDPHNQYAFKTTVEATFAPLFSPVFLGVPTAPTAATGTVSSQIATTQFVSNTIAAITFPVTSVAGRTGAVTLAGEDIVSGTIADARLTTNVVLKSGANVFSALQTFNALTGVQAVVKAYAGQTANLQEWQTSTGAVKAFISPNQIVSPGDNYYFAIKPGTREFRFGCYDGGGMFIFARSDSSNGMQFTPNTANVRLSCTTGDMYITGGPIGKIYLAGNEAGGAVNIEMGCRYSDSSPGVGAHVRIWTVTGQSVNALSILAPGGASAVGGFTAGGRLWINATDSAPTNTTTIVGWANVSVNGTTYKMPLYQ